MLIALLIFTLGIILSTILVTLVVIDHSNNQLYNRNDFWIILITSLLCAALLIPSSIKIILTLITHNIF